MSRYRVEWTETSRRRATVEASSVDEARAMVEDGEVDGVEVDGGTVDVEVRALPDRLL